jgi:uncharacterized membrane-anchored protein YjiN (DUF445 family)
MAKKMTKKEMFAEILESYNLADKHRELIEKTIEQLEKKSASASGDRKPTAKQLENDNLKEKILEWLADRPNEQFTITDLQKQVPFLADFSNQKVSSLVNKLVVNKVVEKAIIKGKSYFSVAKTEW